MASVAPTQAALAPQTCSDPTMASILPRPTPRHQSGPQQVIFALRPSCNLPVVDLSRTLATNRFSTRMIRFTLSLMRNHFHHLVWFFRFGALCFGGLFFVENGVVHYFFLSMMVPSTAVLFATLLFLSLDLLRLLGRNYDYWFLTAINTLNWVTFAYVLHDERAIMSFLGWFSFETVLSVDTSYRTTVTAVNSMILAIPIVLVLCGLVSLQAVSQGNFFTVAVRGYVVCDAADIMGFTTSTLAILLAKMVLLKKRRANAPSAGPGYSKLPCALIRTTLRLVPVRTLIAMGPSVPDLNNTIANAQPHIQTLQLSPMLIARFDARRTLIPWLWWSSPRLTWLVRRRRWLRRLVFTIGGATFIVLVIQTIHLHKHRLAQHGRSHHNRTATTSNSSHAEACQHVALLPEDRMLNLLALTGSALFCGCFVLFFQLDLLRCLLLNFDYVFSVGQAVLFCVSVLDMRCYDLDAGLLVAAWQLWFTWSLSIDAITPLVQFSPLRFPKKLAAFGIVGSMLAGLGIVFDVVFQPHNGLRNRVVLTIATSASHTFNITTRSVLLGRVATITLWSSRQVYVLLTRGNDELNLIRGLLEYESPYGMFPRNRTKHTPAVDDTDE